MTHEELLVHIRREIGASSQREMARKWRISDAYLSDVLSGKRRAGQRLLNALGLEKKVTYEFMELFSA